MFLRNKKYKKKKMIKLCSVYMFLKTISQNSTYLKTKKMIFENNKGSFSLFLDFVFKHCGDEIHN